MLTRVRSRQRDSRALFAALSDLFLCPSCSQWRLSARPFSSSIRRADQPSRPDGAAAYAQRYSSRLPTKPRGDPRRRQDFTAHGQRRGVTTSEAPSIINPPDRIPPRLRDLYAALANLKTAAGGSINLSQLSLILRGLEAPDGGVTRVAVFAFGSPQDTARKLVRLLLADPLGERGRWEDLVEGASGQGEAQSGAVLLRYGEEDTSGVQREGGSPLYREVVVPSTLLGNHNIEILVAGLSAQVPAAATQQDMDRPSDAVLVPSLDGGSNGVVTLVRYPVHKALVVGDGASSCFQFGSFMAGESLEDALGSMIRFTANVAESLPDAVGAASRDGSVSFVNVQRADAAISKLREDIKNSTEFEHGWLHSGVPGLKSWLVAGIPISESSEASATIKPVLRNLIEHLLVRATSTLDTTEARSQVAAAAETSGPVGVKSLQDALEEWSGKAHKELRDELDLVLKGASWIRIAWWKLLWRVDDVSMVVQDTIEHAWLLEAERGCYWLTGRFQAAGLLASSTQDAAALDNVESLAQSAPNNGTIHAPNADPMNEAADEVTLSTRTAPFEGIGRARALRSEADGARLQRKAYHLLLQSLSTFSLSSGLSALLYFSTSFSVYDAGSVAAFGLVFSLRQLQRRWEKERERFGGDLREEGRLLLKSAEDGFLKLISASRDRMGGDGSDVEGRRTARAAIDKAREELRKVV